MGSHGLFRDLPARYGKDWAHCNFSTCNHWVFSHIFLLSLPKLGNVEHEQRKKLSNLPMTKLGTNGPDSRRLKIRSPEKKSPRPKTQFFHPPDFSTGHPPCCLCVLQLHACLTLSQAQQTSQACPAKSHLKELSFPWREKWWKTPSGMKGKTMVKNGSYGLIMVINEITLW